MVFKLVKLMSNMNYLVSKLRDFGIKHRFIPKTREKVKDDFAYVDSEIRDIAYQVKNEIEDYFTKKEGVVPFHWHDIRLKIRSMPCHLEYAVDWGKKVLKSIRGYLGYYARDDKDVYKSYIDNRQEATSKLGDLLKEGMFNLQRQNTEEALEEPENKGDSAAEESSAERADDR